MSVQKKLEVDPTVDSKDEWFRLELFCKTIVLKKGVETDLLKLQKS